MKNCAAIIIAIFLQCLVGMAADTAPDTNTIYNSDPNHLWNRLNETLFERTAQDGKKYGLDELDILYWARTTNLLTGVSHQRALAVLDEFINTHGEKLIQDPLKRAVLQRDLWELFDWSAKPGIQKYAPERKELQKRLAIAIRRLELTTNEIASLPNNYALAEKSHLPNLPRGLFQTNSDWISVRANNVLLTVPTHVFGFGGQSVFNVMFHDSAGRQAGIDYLKRLRAVKPMFIYATNSAFPDEPELNPGLPQFPVNSQWALVRRMCVINTNGQIQPTHLVESIQLRTCLNLTHGFFRGNANPPQRFNEFDMSRNSKAELVSIRQNGKVFTPLHLFSNGIDPFEYHQRGQTNDDSATYGRVILETCAQCHSGSGIYSVNSFTRRLSLPFGPSFETTQMTEPDPEREATDTIFWNEQRFDWGLLKGLWIQEN
jgi:hypothetical protein